MRQRADDLITHGVAVGVVDLLEMVDVQHQHAGGLVGGVVAAQCGLCLFLPVAAPEQAGQCVHAAQFVQHLVLARGLPDELVADGADRQRVQRHHRQAGHHHAHGGLGRPVQSHDRSAGHTGRQHHPQGAHPQPPDAGGDLVHHGQGEQHHAGQQVEMHQRHQRGDQRRVDEQVAHLGGVRVGRAAREQVGHVRPHQRGQQQHRPGQGGCLPLPQHRRHHHAAQPHAQDAQGVDAAGHLAAGRRHGGAGEGRCCHEGIHRPGRLKVRGSLQRPVRRYQQEMTVVHSHQSHG